MLVLVVDQQLILVVLETIHIFPTVEVILSEPRAVAVDQLDDLEAVVDQVAAHQEQDTQAALHCNLVMVSETMVAQAHLALGPVEPLAVAVAVVQLTQDQTPVAEMAEAAEVVLTLLVICC
jgi:hypothetical protein